MQVKSDPRTPLQCLCGYEAKQNWILQGHIRRCRAYPIIERLTRSAEELRRKNDELAEELRCKTEDLARKNEELARRSTTINVTNNLTNINIIAYGQEPTPNLKDVLPLLRPPEESVARYIELKHFSRPETSNMRISNKRSKTMQVVEEDVNRRLRWREKDRKATIEKLVEQNLEELVDLHGAEQIFLWKNWYRSTGLSDAGYDKTGAWKRVNNDVENMLISQR